MDAPSHGKHIISLAKSLKRYRSADAQIAAYLYASATAGRAGLLAAALRSHDLEIAQAEALANGEGFAKPEFKQTILPWLESSGLCHLRKSGQNVVSIKSIVLGYDNILHAVERLYANQEPSLVDQACVALQKFVAMAPIPESDAVQKLAVDFSEQDANLAITLSKSYRLVDYRDGKGLSEPLLYSASVWAGCIENASRALSSLDRTDREIVVELVQRVRQYQGMPRSVLAQWAKTQNVQHIMKLAVSVRLIHETQIEMAGGKVRTFLTTPHFYEDIATEHGQDVCDRIKIFLDSVRNGQHFADSATGSIFSPERLLNALLTKGRIGPCTAIGTDYVTSEKAGIVSVQRAYQGSDRCFMNLVQRDTVQKVYDVITTGSIATDLKSMSASHVREGKAFRSIEECIPEVGDVPEDVAEAERAIILKLREGF
tara:strand:+ start:543 stop:1829 length:1287 start_codon:yes stop_codon:yes gene_type:complete